MTHDYQDHLERPQPEERERDEDFDKVTQEDLDLAEQDLRDRESDFVSAYNTQHSAFIEVIPLSHFDSPGSTQGTNG